MEFKKYFQCISDDSSCSHDGIDLSIFGCKTVADCKKVSIGKDESSFADADSDDEWIGKGSANEIAISKTSSESLHQNDGLTKCYIEGVNMKIACGIENKSYGDDGNPDSRIHLDFQKSDIRKPFRSNTFTSYLFLVWTDLIFTMYIRQ